MPIYEYRCGACGHYLDALQKMSDAPLRKCPECGKSRLRRLVSAPQFRLKGSGWYETDFKGDSEKKRNLVGHEQAGNLGKPLLDLGDLFVVVIDKHETVGADIQCAGNALQAFHFRIPADFKTGDVFPLQHHGIMVVEHVKHIFRIVLACNGKEESAVIQIH